MVRFLRKILLAVYVSSLVLGGVFPLSVSAAIPNVVNYQSRLRSSSLAPITALTSIQFTLYTDPVLGTSGGGLSSSGPVLWKEVHDGITCSQIQPDADGYFSVQLGACTPFPSYITWNQPLYLGVKIASDSEASPRVLLGAHQYALNSQAVNGFTASTTAQANTILALDSNQNFNIATGTFMGAGLTITASSSLQDVTFAIATGTALNLANYLSIGAIRLDQTGTTNLTSGAYLVGVFDEFTNSNATTVQAALRDFDLALTAVSSTSNPTSTLQRAYDGGGIGLGNTINLATSTPLQIQTTAPGLFSSQNGIIITKNGTPNQGIVFGTTNFGSNFSHFGMSDDISNITGASGVFAFYNHNQNNFGFSLLGQSGATKSVFTLTNPDLGNKAAFEIENQSTINSTGILRLRNIPDSANIELHVGMSSPEGVITSDVGNIFFRRDGTASGTQLYIKTQEGSNLGWVGVATVDMLAAGTATLQSAYDGGGSAAGRLVNTVPGQGIVLSSATDTAQSIGFNPILSVVGNNTAGFSTTTGISLGNLDVGGGQVPAIMLGTAVNQVGSTPFGYQLFNPNAGNGYYDVGLANGVETYGLLTFTQTETKIDAVTGTLALRSFSNTNINVSTGQVNLTATAQTDQLGAFQFNYNTSTGQGIRLVNNNDSSDAGISIGLLSPEGLLLADSGSVYMRNSSASGTQMYLKTTDGVNTGWVGVATVDMLGAASSSEADTLQTVTNRGNSTTNTIQFAGGTSTGDLFITGSGTSTISNNASVFGKLSIGSEAMIDSQALSSGLDISASLVIAESYGAELSTKNAVGGIVNYTLINPSAPMTAYVNGMDNGVIIPSTAGDLSQSIAGAYNSVFSQQNSTSSDVIYGLWNEVIHEGSGYMDRAFANQSVVYNQSNGRIRSAIGYQLAVQNNGSGLIDSSIGLAVTAPTNGGGGTILDAKGILIQDHSGIASGNSSNIVSEGINSKNIFEGALSIGAGFAPSSKLHVNTASSTLNPIVTLQNSGADFQIFTSTGTPEGFITGSMGDLASDPVSGRLFIKQSGTSTNTGWVSFATGTSFVAESDTLQTVTSRGSTSTNGLYIQATSTFRNILPETHDLYSLGSTTTRWKELYAVTTFVGSSTWALEQATNEGFSIRNAGSLNDAIRINPNGNVGIGTSDQSTVPLARLHVLGGSVLMGGNSGEEIFQIDPAANTVSIGDYSGWNSNTYLRVDDNNQRITMPNGFVGIGTTTPSTRLDVRAFSSSSTPILTLGNNAGDYQFFNVDSDPNGLITGSRGDMAIDSTNGRLYVKESGASTNTGWVTFVTGTSSGTDTLQTVTNRGNSTTNTIQFAGGTSTGLFTLTKSLAEGGGELEPQLMIKDTTSTGGVVFGRYSTGVDENYSTLAFSADTSQNPYYATSVIFDYSHVNNNMLMRSYGGGIFKNGMTIGDIMNFESGLNHGIGVTSAFNFTNYGTLKGIISFSNPQASMDFFMSTGSPVGAIAANSGSLYFRTDAASTSTAHLYIKTADNSSGGWKQIALLEDVTSTAGTLQTVTNLGNTTTNTIQFAGGTSTGLFVVQSTSTMRDIVPAGPYTGNVSGFNLGSTTSRWKNVWGETVNVGSSTWSLSQNNLNNFAIFNGPNKTGNEVMTIDTATENVGFGTMAQGTAPQARLHVLGGNILMGGNLGEEIFRLDPVANTVSLGDSTAWNSNTYLQVDDNNRRIIMPNGNVGIGTSAPTAQFEVAGRMNQTALNSLPVATGPQKVVIQGRYAYVADIGAEKMTIVDISNPRSMVEMGNVGVSKSPTDIVVQGQYAYVTAFDTNVLYTFDVSDPTNPTQIGVLGLAGGSPTGIVVEGNYGYVITQGGDRLEVIDLSDPTAENSVTSVSVCTLPNQIAISGHYAYVTCLDSTMAVVDIRDPANPTVMNTIAVGSNPQGVHIRGRYLYLTSFNNRELEIYDIKQPTDPRLVSNTSVCRGPSAIKVQSSVAYVSCESDNTITSVDVSDPTRPSIIGTNATSDTPRYFAITGRYLFVPVFGADALESFDLGGGFMQQLEVGGFEADTLTALNGAQIGSNLAVEGSISVGRNARVNGTFTVSGGIPGTSVAFTVNQQGRVGIGTLAPDNLLSVNGDASKIGGGTWSTFSDQRLKSDISAYSDGLDLITKISPVNFRYNGLGGIATSSKSYVGVLAQDIQQVAPYMVATTSVMLHKSDSAPTEVLTFDPNAITYALINSVKQLNAKLDQGSNNKQVTITTTTQGEIHFGGIISFDADTVGQAKILSGSKEVRVTFSQAYSAQPIVTISPMDFVDAMYRVTDVNNTGFTIQLNANQSGDRLFNWHAFAGSSAQVFISDGTTSTVQLIEQSAQPDEQASSTSQITPPVEPASTPDPTPIESEATSTTSTEPTL